MKPSLILIGGGGHCRACIDVLEQEGKFKIAGIVERLGAPTNSIFGYPIIGNDDNLPKLREQFNLALVTVGQIKKTGVRKRLFKKLILTSHY